MIYSIVKTPSKVLFQPTSRVHAFDHDLSVLIEDMFETMYEAEGVGLAANQIGIPLSVFVYDCGEHGKGYFVNPVIRPRDPSIINVEEGCLSVPITRGAPDRWAVTECSGQDKNGQKTVTVGEGLLSRCFQHEFDHLSGRLFTSRLM